VKSFASELSDGEQDAVAQQFAAVFPRVLPADWRPITEMGEFWNARWLKSADGLKVAFEVEFNDGQLWIHVSFSRRYRDPSYFDMVRVKEVFFGHDRKAIMVLPKRDEHYNLHAHCLHLYSPLTKDPLPDFRTHGGQL